MAGDNEQWRRVSPPSPPSPVQQQQLWRFHHNLPNANLTFLMSDFPWLLAKAAVDNTEGKNWLGSKQNWIAESELELGIDQTDSARAVVGRPRGRHLEKARASQAPPAAESPCTWLQAVTDLASTQGTFLEALFLIFSSLNANPFNKTVPVLFSPSFPLISFSQWKKNNPKKKIPVSLVWPHLDLHWFFPCHSCYQQELAYGFKGKLGRRKERHHFDGNKGQRNNLPSTKKLICVWFPKQSFQKPMLILGYTKKP